MLYSIAADAILLVHALFVLFVVLGLVLILLGWRLSWAWVGNCWFRLAHLSAIAVVVLQAWAGRLCPLTIWEMQLRERAGEVAYTGSFISHWVGRLLYYEAPLWVFAIIYTLFGAVVLVTWFLVPPRFGKNNHRGQ